MPRRLGRVVASHWLFDSVASPIGFMMTGDHGRILLPLAYAVIALGGFALFRRTLPEFRGLTLAAIARHFSDWAAGRRKAASSIIPSPPWRPPEEG